AARLRRSRGRARVRAFGWRAVVVFALLAALPLVPGVSRYYLLLAFDALLFGAIAMSLDLLMGYTGLVSFGHAAFYGLGAYATAILMERGVQSVWACVGFALLVVGLYALVVSYFATARRGIYFALLTLIFAEVVYTFFRYTQTFGGSDGIQGLPDATLFPGLVISVMIGGLGTLVGPIIGGVFFTILRDKVSSIVDWYFIVIGVVLIVIVLFMPRGLLGLRRIFSRERATA